LQRWPKPTSRTSIAAFGRTPPRAPPSGRRSLLNAAQALEEFPHRCPLAPESGAELEIRQLIYRRYRVLFTVAGDTVYILHIRHSARQRLTSGAIDEDSE
jgi:plasmid stabilization system protein ParE